MEKKKILVIDDEEIIHSFITDVLEDEDYEIICASSVSAGLQELLVHEYSVALIDLYYSGSSRDGVEIIKYLKKNDPDFPVIAMSGKALLDDAIDAIRAGACDFLKKPFSAPQLKETLRSALQKAHLTVVRKQVVHDLTEKVGKEEPEDVEKLTFAFEYLQEVYLNVVKALVDVIEEKDAYTKNHSEGVALYSSKIAEAYGLPPTQVTLIVRAAHLHDIGKVGIPDSILKKPGKLTADECEVIKKHPEIGIKILRNLPFLGAVIDLIAQHHERFDGHGYPRGIGGKEIQIGARILCVADAYDAMRSSRSYRVEPFTKDEAAEEIRINSGSQFDPAVVEAFFAAIDSFE